MPTPSSWRSSASIVNIGVTMGMSLVVGCSLIAFGPPLMLWLILVGRRSVLVIIGITSAFFWLVSMALASLLWTIVPAAQNAWILVTITGVGLQGFGRHVLARVYIKAEKMINEARNADSAANGGPGGRRRTGEGEAMGGNETVQLDSHEHISSSLKLNGISSSIAAGVGWGAIHAVIIVGTALSKHFGPGAAFSKSCPRIPSVIVISLSAQAFFWLDLLLMAATFAASRSGDASLLWWSLASHYLAASTTGFNLMEGGCVVSLPLLYAVVIISALVLGYYGPLRAAMSHLRR